MLSYFTYCSLFNMFLYIMLEWLLLCSLAVIWLSFYKKKKKIEKTNRKEIEETGNRKLINKWKNISPNMLF